MFCWRVWPNSLGSATRASVGPWPPTSELSGQHPCSTTPVEPPAARESHLGRRRLLLWPTLRTMGRQPAVAVLVETRVRREPLVGRELRAATLGEAAASVPELSHNAPQIRRTLLSLPGATRQSRPAGCRCHQAGWNSALPA